MKSKNKKPVKVLVVVLLLLVLLASAAQITISYLTANDSLSNSFVVGNTDITVTEVFDAENKIKYDVAVKNEGNVPVYVRATMKIYWEDTNGNILLEAPEENIDYTLVINGDSGWVLGFDGFYYYSTPLDYNEGSNQTDVLIKECKQIKEYSDGRVLVVDIASQSIQATPSIAVEDAWGVQTDSSGALTPMEVL